MSNPRRVTCPHCKTEHEIASDFEAQLIPCPQCGKHIRIRPLPKLLSHAGGPEEVAEGAEADILLPGRGARSTRHSIEIHIKSIDVPFRDILMFTLKNFAAALLIGLIASLAYFLLAAVFHLLENLFSFLIEINV